jgi:hypothetical protein
MGIIITIFLLIVFLVAVAMLTGLKLMQRSVDVRRQAAKAENVIGIGRRQKVAN